MLVKALVPLCLFAVLAAAPVSAQVQPGDGGGGGDCASCECFSYPYNWICACWGNYPLLEGCYGHNWGCSGQPCSMAEVAPTIPLIQYLAARPWLRQDLDDLMKELGRAATWDADRRAIRLHGCTGDILAVIEIPGGIAWENYGHRADPLYSGESMSWTGGSTRAGGTH